MQTENLEQETIVPNRPLSRKLSEPGPIWCDRTENCPHCLLSRITPISAYVMPHKRRRT